MVGVTTTSTALLDLREGEGQEIGQIAVQPVVHVLDLDRFRTVGLGDTARRVETDIQQVGRGVGPEAVLGDGLLGQPQDGSFPPGCRAVVRSRS